MERAAWPSSMNLPKTEPARKYEIESACIIDETFHIRSRHRLHDVHVGEDRYDDDGKRGDNDDVPAPESQDDNKR